MEKYTGKKRNSEYEIPFKSDFISRNQNIKDNNLENKEVNNDEFKILNDECFNNFIKGDTNKLIENYNLMKQKFYDSI